jgi:hypothetical protein
VCWKYWYAELNDSDNSRSLIFYILAYLHAEDNNPLTRPLTIVTASVDRIDLLNKLHADRDVKMQGTSMMVL